MRCPRLLILVAVMAIPAGRLTAGPICGGVPDWVNNCPAGTDKFSSRASVTILDANFVPIFAGDLYDSATTIYRGAGSGGLMLTEMVALNLTGSGITVHAGDGDGNLASDGVTYSPGYVQQQTPPTGDPVLADSFFDIFFEVDYGPLHLHNYLSDTGPHLSMHAVISGVPPIGAIYEPPIDVPIPLYMTGVPDPLAYLVHASHVPTPEPSGLLLVACGTVGLLTLRRRHRVSGR